MRPFAQAARALLRRPSFTFTVILTLALGVGVTTAAFTVVDGVLLRPLPFPDAGQLVTVFEASPSPRAPISLIAPNRLDDWNRLNHSFTAISGSYSENVTDTSGPEPERLAGDRVMPRYFDVFQMRPLLGRTFLPDEERFGGPNAAIISENLWTSRFSRRASAVGARLVVGGVGYTIVGVMPSAFTTTTADVWIPAQLQPFMLQMRDARFVVGCRTDEAWGDARPGARRPDARAERPRRTSAL